VKNKELCIISGGRSQASVSMTNGGTNNALASGYNALPAQGIIAHIPLDAGCTGSHTTEHGMNEVTKGFMGN
jgi:hypothetical protein